MMYALLWVSAYFLDCRKDLKGCLFSPFLSVEGNGNRSCFFTFLLYKLENTDVSH